MSHVSSVATSSYPYRGTLSRLDQNGDGMLSSDERAAGQSPGLLTVLMTAPSVVLEQPCCQALTTASSAQTITPAFAEGCSSAATTIADQQTIDAYRGTYGQYELDNVA